MAIVGTKVFRAIRALGGVKDTVKLLLGAGNIEDAHAAGGGAAVTILGVDSVADNCF